MKEVIKRFVAEREVRAVDMGFWLGIGGGAKTDIHTSPNAGVKLGAATRTDPDERLTLDIDRDY
jgi:hypothetical protein